MIDDILRNMGLSNGEITIYNALLNNGSCTVNMIHEKVGMERRNIYDILNKLIERGFITYIDENKHRTFRVADPRAIISYLEDDEQRIEQLRKQAQTLLPQLKQLTVQQNHPFEAQVFRGVEGMKTVWNDMLNEKEIRWIGSGNFMPNTYLTFFDQWTRKRIKNKIKSYHLFRNEIRGHAISKELQFHKFLPIEFSQSPTVTVIYGNKTAQLVFGHDFFAIVVESADLAKSNRAYHKYLWDNVAKS